MSDSIKDKFPKKCALSDEELEKVSGGEGGTGVIKVVYGYAYLTSLEGITVEDCPLGFYLDGVKYDRAFMTTINDLKIFEIYCSEGNMVLLPQ